MANPHASFQDRLRWARKAKRQSDETIVRLAAENERLREQRNLFGYLLERICRNYDHPAADFIAHDIEQARTALARGTET